MTVRPIPFLLSTLSAHPFTLTTPTSAPSLDTEAVMRKAEAALALSRQQSASARALLSFEPSKGFVGHRPGMAFHDGLMGVGYYADVAAAGAAGQAPATAAQPGGGASGSASAAPAPSSASASASAAAAAAGGASHPRQAAPGLGPSGQAQGQAHAHVAGLHSPGGARAQPHPLRGSGEGFPAEVNSDPRVEEGKD